MEVHKETLLSIWEFLRHNELKQCLAVLETECSEQGIVLDTTYFPALEDVVNEIKQELLDCFDCGDSKKFFDMWDKHIPTAVAQGEKCFKLEFFLQVYFAIFPGHPCNPNKNPAVLVESMNCFREYLESKGAMLSKSPEYLTFYALPFVPNPDQHPSFTQYYSVDWVVQVKEETDEFLANNVKSGSRPKLQVMFEEARKPQPPPGPSPEMLQEQADKLAQAQDALSQSKEQMERLQHDKKEAKRSAEQYYQDYHAIVGPVAEMIDLLHRSMRGAAVDPVSVKSVFGRLRPVLPQQYRGLCDPSASLRSSQRQPQQKGGAARDHRHKRDRERDWDRERDRDRDRDHRGHERDPHLMPPPQPPAKESVLRARPGIVPPVDFRQIAKDLLNPSLTDLDKCLLLQALRWRVGRCSSAQTRRQVLQAYLQNDVVGLHSQQGLLEKLLSRTSITCEYTVRLLNTLSFEWLGRQYLLESSSLLHLLCDVMRNENNDSIIRQQTLATLQKLSLRRKAQSMMINFGLVEWLLDILSDMDVISKYTLEYATALLLNLSLRSAGRARCEAADVNVLDVLNQLLESDNTQVRFYTNGTLYSVLSRPGLRSRARHMGMEDFLKYLAKNADSQFARQLEYILKQLNSDEVDKDASDDEAAIDEDSDGDTGDDEVLVDEESEETLDQMLARSGSSHPQGEQLLCSKYLSKTSDAQKEAEDIRRAQEQAQNRPQSSRRRQPPQSIHEPLSRPVTPAGSLSARGARKPSTPSRDAGQYARVPTAMNEEDELQMFQAQTEIPRTPVHLEGIESITSIKEPARKKQ